MVFHLQQQETCAKKKKGFPENRLLCTNTGILVWSDFYVAQQLLNQCNFFKVCEKQFANKARAVSRVQILVLCFSWIKGNKFGKSEEKRNKVRAGKKFWQMETHAIRNRDGLRGRTTNARRMSVGTPKPETSETQDFCLEPNLVLSKTFTFPTSMMRFSDSKKRKRFQVYGFRESKGSRTKKYNLEFSLKITNTLGFDVRPGIRIQDWK